MNNQSLLNARDTLKQPLTRILEFILLSFILFIGMSTILLMLGNYFSAKFSIVALLIFISAIILVISMAFLTIKVVIVENKWKRADIYCLFCVLLISLSGAMLSTSINRPDNDDSTYIPRAIFYTENPEAILDNSVNWIVVPDKLATSEVFRYYELSQAAFSSIIGSNYLNFYHIIFPGIVSFFICLSMFLLLRIFEPKQNIALLSSLFFIFLLIALGETHRSYGNLSFARAFQGKWMFLTIGLQSWTYFSLRYFLMQDTLSRMTLIALGIGMAGATTTAMVFLPLLALVIFASYYLNERKSILSIFYSNSEHSSAAYKSMT